MTDIHARPSCSSKTEHSDDEGCSSSKKLASDKKIQDKKKEKLIKEKRKILKRLWGVHSRPNSTTRRSEDLQQKKIPKQQHILYFLGQILFSYVNASLLQLIFLTTAAKNFSLLFFKIVLKPLVNNKDIR